MKNWWDEQNFIFQFFDLGAFFFLLLGNLIIFLSAKCCQRCHSSVQATSIIEEDKINDFSFNSLGAKSQIISTTLRAYISMELCDARIGSDGISFSKHISTHTRFDYVFSVRLILKLTRSGNQRHSSGKCQQKVSQVEKKLLNLNKIFLSLSQNSL